MSAWYEKAVFYHIYPFGLLGAPKENRRNEEQKQEPSPNDTDPAAGSFNRLTPWISHMQKLGCTALYIGPLFESSTHGYDTRDFRQVDRRLGTNEEFQSFVRQCHEAGIRVVVDGVFNHTGREFFAFQDLIQKKEYHRMLHLATLY